MLLVLNVFGAIIARNVGVLFSVTVYLFTSSLIVIDFDPLPDEVFLFSSFLAMQKFLF